MPRPRNPRATTKKNSSLNGVCACRSGCFPVTREIMNPRSNTMPCSVVAWPGLARRVVVPCCAVPCGTVLCCGVLRCAVWRCSVGGGAVLWGPVVWCGMMWCGLVWWAGACSGVFCFVLFCRCEAELLKAEVKELRKQIADQETAALRLTSEAEAARTAAQQQLATQGQSLREAEEERQKLQVRTLPPIHKLGKCIAHPSE